MAATVELVIGAPVWDRAWALPLWFESVRANVNPAKTGLVFVIPSTDTATREAVAELSEGFDWVEVIRDQGEQLPREERPGNGHATLAQARNQILKVVAGVRPPWYVSWDTDFLVPENTLIHLAGLNLPVCTVWAWLNRQRPKKIRHFDGHSVSEVFYQPPVCATAMQWNPRRDGDALHYPAHEFALRSHGVWQTDVTLAFQLMTQRAYSKACYRPHPGGEDVSFAWQLEQAGVPRFCCGDIQGVHLYDRNAKDERELGWPDVMSLAREVPLAAHWTEPRTLHQQVFGFFPVSPPVEERITA